jgi:hypothetical protein
MLEDFLRKQEIDIIFLQEVTMPVFDDIRGFVAHTNIGTTGRGTAILTRDHIQLTNIVCLTTGRGMAAVLYKVTLVNVYAPSCAERQKGNGISLLERPSISTARHPHVTPGGKRLQQHPHKHGRHRTPQLQSGAARVSSRIRPS